MSLYPRPDRTTDRAPIYARTGVFQKVFPTQKLTPPPNFFFQATIAFHKTGTVGADEWYKTAFAPFLNGALHSGEAGGHETGAAFKTVFNVVVMRGREAENETVAVIMVSPSESAAKIVKFFDDKNPFWQTGRDAGWLLGPITCYKTTPFLCRGPDPKTGFPPGFKKGNGAQLAVFGSKIAVQKDWVPAFTSADSDKLHDASGIFTSVAGSLETGKASEFKSRFKSVAVVHGFGTYKQAQTFNAKFVAASEPPFDGISQILDNFQGRAFEVISDTTFPEYLPKAGSRE